MFLVVAGRAVHHVVQDPEAYVHIEARNPDQDHVPGDGQMSVRRHDPFACSPLGCAPGSQCSSKSGFSLAQNRAV
jgi:hypothetical protein